MRYIRSSYDSHRRYLPPQFCRWAGVVAMCFGLFACGDDTTPSDGGPGRDVRQDPNEDTPVVDAPVVDARDAGPSASVILQVSDERGSLYIDATGALQLSRGDESLLTAGSVGALAFGTTPRGDERYHSPINSIPNSIRWRPLLRGVEQVDGTHGIFEDEEGRRATVALETVSPGIYRLRVTATERAADVAMARLTLSSDDGSYQGLGERFGHADARGTVVPMQLGIGGTRSGTNEYHVPIPFFVSSNGYGVFVATRESAAFDMAASDPEAVQVRLEGKSMVVYFFVADEPAQVIAQYAAITGLPRLPPRWAFAPMYWRNEWNDSDDARMAAARVRAEDIPTTSFWIDNPWEASYNDHIFDPARFPDAPALLSGLRDSGFAPLLWSTPYLDAVEEGESPTNEAERLFVQALENDMLIMESRTGNPYLGPSSPRTQGAMIDFTNPDAAAFWRGRLEPLIRLGVRAFKLDFGEDVLVDFLGVRTGLLFSDGTTERETHNVYATHYHRPYRQVLDEGAGDDGGFLLVRAESWGGQDVADLIWPGDLDNDFREGLDGEVGGLPSAVTGLISLAASGFPSFASDIGGFRGGMPEREALLRWAEHTAFSPFMQLGGAGDHHDPWLYDMEAGTIYHDLARAHMALVPYFRMYALRASETGEAPVLAPAIAYPEDRDGYIDPYAYLLGEDLFVAPVIEEGATQRTLHLPPGEWIHWYTHELFAGAMNITVAAPLGMPPVFIRVGAVLPLLPNDLDTLLVTADPDVIDPSQRPWLRAQFFPGERREITTEEGPTFTAERVADGVDMRIVFDADGLMDARLRIELGHTALTVAEVRVDGAAVSATDLAAVLAGCDGVCWAADGDALQISVRGANAAIEIR